MLHDALRTIRHIPQAGEEGRAAWLDMPGPADQPYDGVPFNEGGRSCVNKGLMTEEENNSDSSRRRVRLRPLHGKRKGLACHALEVLALARLSRLPCWRDR